MFGPWRSGLPARRLAATRLHSGAAQVQQEDLGVGRRHARQRRPRLARHQLRRQTQRQRRCIARHPRQTRAWSAFSFCTSAGVTREAAISACRRVWGTVSTLSIGRDIGRSLLHCFPQPRGCYSPRVAALARRLAGEARCARARAPCAKARRESVSLLRAPSAARAPHWRAPWRHHAARHAGRPTVRPCVRAALRCGSWGVPPALTLTLPLCVVGLTPLSRAATAALAPARSCRARSARATRRCSPCRT